MRYCVVVWRRKEYIPAKALLTTACAIAVRFPCCYHQLHNVPAPPVTLPQVVTDMMATVAALQLTNCWQWKPLMDGKQLMQVRASIE